VALRDRNAAVLRSVHAAPLGMRIWFFGPVVSVNFWGVWEWIDTGHPLAVWTSMIFAFVAVADWTLALIQRGVSRLAALPHLLFWIPGQIIAGLWLFVWGGLPIPALTAFAWSYFTIIGLSNLLDLINIVRWFRGDRAIFGSDG
jgi:hypothetical protein